MPKIDTINQITTKELIEKTGVSPRQLNYWIDHKVLHPLGDSNPGTGHIRYFDAAIIPKVCTLVAVSVVFDGRYGKGVSVGTLYEIFKDYEEGELDMGFGISIKWVVASQELQAV